MSTIRVTLLQLDIEWGSPRENISRAERLMATQPDSDLYVLPEMWATGFATEPSGIAEDESASLALQWMRQTARSRRCALAGSLAVRISPAEGAACGQPLSPVYVNRHYFIDGRNATEKYYDKHHLFRYGGEDRYYTAGESHTVVAFGGFRLLLLTCYDLRFPVWSRYADRMQYDAIICVANWPESRQNAWQILTRARAMENQAYLVGCNRVGDDRYSHYRGLSAIVSPIGKTLAACPPDEPAAVSFLLNSETLDHQRTKFRVLDDRDIW